jgi:hypothetical protein
MPYVHICFNTVVWGMDCRFVSWPVHVAIMRKYRAAGKLTSTNLTAERFVAAQVWQEATRRLAVDVEPS